MTFYTYELAVYSAILFFIMLSLAACCYGIGFREGRLEGMRSIMDHQQRKQREHEEQKRAWFQK